MDNVVSIYKALGDPNRLKILQMLCGQEMSVCEIMDNLKLSQPAVSHHMKILRQAELIESTKQGKLVFYCLNQCGLQQIIKSVTTHIENLLSAASGPCKPSMLRENPNYCEIIGLKKSICEKDN